MGLLAKFRRKESPLQLPNVRKRTSQVLASPSIVAKQPRMDKFFSPPSESKPYPEMRDGQDIGTCSPEDLNILEIKRPLEDGLDLATDAVVKEDKNELESSKSTDFQVDVELLHCDTIKGEVGDANLGVVYDKAADLNEEDGYSLKTANFSMTALRKRLEKIKGKVI